MGTSSHGSKAPRRSVEDECPRRGVGSVVAGCVDLLNGRPVDDDLILALGGPPAGWIRTGEPPGPPYWLGWGPQPIAPAEPSAAIDPLRSAATWPAGDLGYGLASAKRSRVGRAT